MAMDKDTQRLDDVDEWMLLLGVAGAVVMGAVAFFSSDAAWAPFVAAPLAGGAVVCAAPAVLSLIRKR